MDDAFAVEVGERGEELREPELQLRFGESFVSALGAPRQAGEVAAVAVPHDDAYGVRLFDPTAVVRDDVGVAERGDELAFLDAELPLPFAQPRQRDLLEDVPTRGGGVGPAGLDDPRGAEGTLTDLLEDVVRVHARRALVRGCHRVSDSLPGRVSVGAHTKRALQIQTTTATDGGVTSRGFAYETLSGRGHARRDATWMAARECVRV